MNTSTPDSSASLAADQLAFLHDLIDGSRYWDTDFLTSVTHLYRDFVTTTVYDATRLTHIPGWAQSHSIDLSVSLCRQHVRSLQSCADGATEHPHLSLAGHIGCCLLSALLEGGFHNVPLASQEIDKRLALLSQTWHRDLPALTTPFISLTDAGEVLFCSPSSSDTRSVSTPFGRLTEEEACSFQLPSPGVADKAGHIHWYLCAPDSAPRIGTMPASSDLPLLESLTRTQPESPHASSDQWITDSLFVCAALIQAIR